MQQIQVRKACKCNYSARGFSESEQEQILVNLLSNPLCFRLRDDFTAPLRAPLCSLLCVCVRAGDSRQSSGSYDFCRGLKSIDCSFDWSGVQIVLFLDLQRQKVSGISIGCRSLQGSREHSSQMSTRYQTKTVDWWLLHLNTSRWLQPFCRNRRTLYFPFQPRFDVATATDANWWPRHWPGVSLDFHDWSVWHFLSGFLSVDWLQSKLWIGNHLYTFSPVGHERGDTTPSQTCYRNIQCASVLTRVQTDARIQTDICMSFSISLSYTHANHSVPAHTHTHTQSLSHAQKHRYHSFSALNDFRSQLSHITGEEGVRPSIKELFKWNHVLWWFKANISLAHSCWMCSSEEPGLQVSEDALPLRCERRSAGATCRSAGARGVVNGVKMKVELGSSRANFPRVWCDVNVDHTEVFPARCDCDFRERRAERREDKTRRSDFSLFAAVTCVRSRRLEAGVRHR